MPITRSHHEAVLCTRSAHGLFNIIHQSRHSTYWPECRVLTLLNHGPAGEGSLNRITNARPQLNEWRPPPWQSNRIPEDVKLQEPTRVSKYQSDRTADRQLNPQQIRKHHRRVDNSCDSAQTSSSHQNRRVLGATYKLKKLCSARLPAYTRNTRERPCHVIICLNHWFKS